MTAVVVFKACVEAMRKGTLIERVSATDKEFHFQNWFKTRLQKTRLHFEVGGRNSYPDFRLPQPEAGSAGCLSGLWRYCARPRRDFGDQQHSRDDGGQALAEAVLDAGFMVVNSQPVKSEISVATRWL